MSYSQMLITDLQNTIATKQEVLAYAVDWADKVNNGLFAWVDNLPALPGGEYYFSTVPSIADKVFVYGLGRDQKRSYGAVLLRAGWDLVKAVPPTYECMDKQVVLE